MSKLKISFIVVISLFTIYTIYSFVNSLEEPKHIHSRDDAPRGSANQTSRTAGDIKELETQLQNNPGDYVLIMKLGHAYLENQQFAKAVEIFRKAVQLKPQEAEPQVDLGIALRQNRQIDEALAALNRATKSFPEYGEAWLQLGVLNRFNLKNNQKALQYFQKFLSLEPRGETGPQIKEEIERIKMDMKKQDGVIK